MSVDHKAALDSNCITFWLQAMSDGYDPEFDDTELADERSALLLAFLYTGDCYTLLPEAEREIQRIRIENNRRQHEELSVVHMIDLLEQISEVEIERRVTELIACHSGVSDCRALAEAEFGGVPVLLTFDKTMLSNLAGEAREVQLTTPSRYFQSLGIRPGSRPKREPTSDNPLSAMTWWRL